MLSDNYSKEKQYYGILGGFNIKKPLVETMSKDINAGSKAYGRTPQQFLTDVRETFRNVVPLIRPSIWQMTDIAFDKNRILDDKVNYLFYYVLGDVISEQNVVTENIRRYKELSRKYFFLPLIPGGYKSKLLSHGNDICFGCVQIKGYHGGLEMYEFDEKMLTEEYSNRGEGEYWGQDKRELKNRVKTILTGINCKLEGSREFVVLPYGDTEYNHEIILFGDGNAYIGDTVEGKDYTETDLNAARTFAKLAHEDPKKFIMDLISGMIAEEPQSYCQSNPGDSYGYENFNESQNVNDQEPPIDATVEILKWKQLLDCGAITQEEYDAKKKQLLNM